MSELTIARRVGILEKKVEALELLPHRIDALESQVVELRGEMRAEFSALRAEMAAMGQSIRDDLRAEMTSMGQSIRDDLRVEIRAGDEETRRYMRLLHEDVIARIAALDERRGRRRRGK